MLSARVQFRELRNNTLSEKPVIIPTEFKKKVVDRQGNLHESCLLDGVHNNLIGKMYCIWK